MTSNRDMFKKALLEAMLDKYENELADADMDKEINCSKEHYLKLKSLFALKQQKNKSISKRSLIAILIAAALLLTGCTVYIYRNEIKDFIEEIYEKYIRVTYDTDNENLMGNNITKVYQPTYIPDGYELVNQSDTPLYVFHEWRNPNENIITLQQTSFDGTDFFLDAEHGNTEIIYCVQYEIYCRKIDNSYHYIWNDGEYAFTLTSTIQIPNDELLKIIEGMV